MNQAAKPVGECAFVPSHLDRHERLGDLKPIKPQHSHLARFLRRHRSRRGGFVHRVLFHHLARIHRPFVRVKPIVIVGDDQFHVRQAEACVRGVVFHKIDARPCFIDRRPPRRRFAGHDQVPVLARHPRRPSQASAGLFDPILLPRIRMPGRNRNPRDRHVVRLEYPVDLHPMRVRRLHRACENIPHILDCFLRMLPDRQRRIIKIMVLITPQVDPAHLLGAPALHLGKQRIKRLLRPWRSHQVIIKVHRHLKRVSRHNRLGHARRRPRWFPIHHHTLHHRPADAQMHLPNLTAFSNVRRCRNRQPIRQNHHSLCRPLKPHHHAPAVDPNRHAGFHQRIPPVADGVPCPRRAAQHRVHPRASISAAVHRRSGRHFFQFHAHAQFIPCIMSNRNNHAIPGPAVPRARPVLGVRRIRVPPFG